MRKFLAILIAFIFGTISPIFSAERFMTFPALGKCNGTYVRYRDNPDTEGEILGRLNKPERVIVLGQTANDGEIWYEIEDPHTDGTAFVFGKYIEPVYGETTQQGEAYRMMVGIIQAYGITPERAKLYNGPKVQAEYKEGFFPVKFEARNEGCTFGDVRIGDDTERLREFLGEPDTMSASEWEYRVENDTILLFELNDRRIVSMIYEHK